MISKKYTITIINSGTTYRDLINDKDHKFSNYAHSDTNWNAYYVFGRCHRLYGFSRIYKYFYRAWHINGKQSAYFKGL